MSTDDIYFTDELTGPATYLQLKSSDPYDSCSVASDYTYSSNKIEVKYNTSNALFSEFVMEKVFKLVNPEGQTLYSNFSTSYIPNTANSKGEYVNPAANGGGHLAGTILAFQCTVAADDVVKEASPFNVAIVIEETYDTDGKTISKVDLKMRESEPLAQSIIDTNGTVYVFKKGTKLSEVGRIALEQWNGDPPTPNGYVHYNLIVPSNMSKDIKKSSSEVSQIKMPDDTNKYAWGDSAPSGEASTHFTGYIVIGGFHDNTSNKDTVDDIVGCKPYITILRVEKSAVIKTDNTALVTNGTNGIMFDSININNASGNIKTQDKNVPSYSVFKTLFTDNLKATSENPNGKACKGSMNFYVLNEMIKPDQ